MDEIVFGERDPKLTYKTRIGAYVVVPDAAQKQILVVEPPNHSYLLPGGGIEPGESDVETIARELIEEVGGTMQITDYLGRASEYFYSTWRKQAYYHPAHFYAGTSLIKTQAPLEGDFNQIKWMPLEEAGAALKRPTHRWALAKWRQQHHC